MGERRATWAAVLRIAEGLGERDWAILRDVALVRVLTGRQVERLHFFELAGVHRDRTRRRVLERLATLGLLMPLERRIGGVRAGSAGLAWALGLAGQRLLALDAQQSLGRTRQPGAPTERFLQHTLLGAELYVQLVEASRAGRLRLVRFVAEPACWWRASEGEWIKPDALAVVGGGDFEDSWAIENDQSTESLPTLKHKLSIFVDLARNGEAGPQGGPLPRVLVSVPHERRLADVRALVASLPEPAEQLFVATLHSGAAQVITEVLRE